MNNNDIQIIEVGPRDGLQNVREVLSIEQKINLIEYLLSCGLNQVEAGSFVREDRMPAMAGSATIAAKLKKFDQQLWYLAPNQKGLEAALATNVRQIAFFTATSETFNQKNIGLGVAQSIDVIHDCINHLTQNGYRLITDWQTPPQTDKDIRLRLYISTVIGCPYEGPQKPQATHDLIQQLQPLGFAQISLGDTIGVGTPSKWGTLFKGLDASLFSQHKLALHCHDTYGTALACVANGLNHGIAAFDSSLGGLGGCPYAAGATGNLATEDLVYFLGQEGIKNLPDLDKLLQAFHPSRTGSLPNISRAGNALRAKLGFSSSF